MLTRWFVSVSPTSERLQLLCIEHSILSCLPILMLYMCSFAKTGRFYLVWPATKLPGTGKLELRQPHWEHVAWCWIFELSKASSTRKRHRLISSCWAFSIGSISKIRLPSPTDLTKSGKKESSYAVSILLRQEIRQSPVDMVNISVFTLDMVLLHPKWFRISSINSIYI